MKKPFMLMILDGFGLKDEAFGNAIAAASTPNLDKIFETYPFAQLRASGLAVGLPEGQMGNSEVGHLNIGAGRVVYQELTRITKAINDGAFNGNAALLDAVAHAQKTGGAVHIMGLLSDGGVHSHIRHIKAALSMASLRGASKIYLHCFLDGRDVPGASEVRYTIDGTDPRYSDSAKVYSSAVTVSSGTVVRAAAFADDKFTSSVAEKTA